MDKLLPIIAGMKIAENMKAGGVEQRSQASIGGSVHRAAEKQQTGAGDDKTVFSDETTYLRGASEEVKKLHKEIDIQKDQDRQESFGRKMSSIQQERQMLEKFHQSF